MSSSSSSASSSTNPSPPILPVTTTAVETIVESIVKQLIQSKGQLSASNWASYLVSTMEEIETDLPTLEGADKKTVAIAALSTMVNDSSLSTGEKSLLRAIVNVSAGPAIDCIVAASKGLTKINFKGGWVHLFSCCTRTK